VVQLLGPNVCFTHQQFVTKLPDRGEQRSDIPLHQDDGYGRLEPPLDCTVWVALVDTDERNGCLWIVPRSHELGLLDHDRAGVNPVLREAKSVERAIALNPENRALARRDPDLAALFKRNGMPPMWARRPGFATLVHIVLEQQVSIVAARTLFQRLRSHLGEMTPRAVATHGVTRLRRFGLTRQKASYCHELALAVRDGRLDLGRVARADDATGRETLLAMRGLGSWSVDIYYLMALRRPDIWPCGDLALAVALRDVKRLPGRPGNEEQQEISASWAPWRSVAARLLWHYYLSTRRPKAS